MKLPQTGGCQCGKLRYEIAEAPRMIYACHCIDCQRITGSAFSMGIVVTEGAFHLTGPEPRERQKIAASGRGVSHWLCPECGSWICSGTKPGFAAPGALRVVRAGTLDDTSWVIPAAHFWTRSKQPWIGLPEGGHVFETQPSDLLAFLTSTN